MPNAPCDGGRNQGSLCHGLQQAGNGTGWRILRLPRTSTSVCVGGGVRRAAVGSDGGLCDGGRGQAADGGVPGWDGGGA